MSLLFMQFVPDWAPNLHPLVVHFPIAILFFAALMDILTFFLHERWWDERKTTVVYLIGAVIAVFVYFTGGMAADSIDIPKAAYHAVGEHAGWAEWTIWFFAIYAILRVIVSSMGFLQNSKIHVTFFLLSLIGLFFLYETGEHGAELVFGYGLGTGNIEYTKTPPDSLTHAGFTPLDDGGWTWKTGAGSDKILQDKFNSFAASSGGMVHGDQLELPAGNTFFASRSKFGDFQLDLAINARQLQGNLLILHHVQDSTNYDYMALKEDGSAELGRVRDNEREVFENASSVNWKKASHLRFVNSGEHKRGYVDSTLVLHGHIEPGPEGGVGLKIEGSGSVSLKSFNVSPIKGEEHEEHEHEEH